MTGKDDQFYSTTTIYVNTEQLSTGHPCQDQSSDQMSVQLNANGRANNLYQNVSEEPAGNPASDSLSDSLNNDSLNNSANFIGHLQPPVPAPRVSLLKRLKQRQEEPNGRVLEQKLEQIDENLNLVLKQHEEKFKLEDSLIESAGFPQNDHHLFNSAESDLYVSNDRLQFEEQQSVADQPDHLGLHLSQFALPGKLNGKRISELNRNTYISDSDVNERFSNNYNELDEQIYSEIIFDEGKRRSNTESWYDFPSPTDSIKFINLRPPPLPPPRIKPAEATTGDPSTEIENALKSDVRIEINDEARNDLNEEERNNEANEPKMIGGLPSSSLQSDLQNDLRNALRNHFKSDLFKSSSSPLNNSSSLNSSLNSGQFKANSNNPFLMHSSSDLKLNELKESLNLMRKDHLSTLNHQSKKERAPKLNKDDLLLLERQLDGFSSTIAPTTNLPTTKSSLVS